MTTWAQIINDVACDVLVGENLGTLVAPGYNPNPGHEWVEVPDGTLSGATTSDGKNFTNPIPQAPGATPPDPILTAIAALQSQITALAQATSPAALQAVQAATQVTP